MTALHAAVELYVLQKMNPPIGFQIFNDELEYRISYKSKGMGCMIFFVGSISLIMGVTSTAALFFDIPQNFFGEDADYIKSKSWFPVAITLFYSAVLLGCISALWKLLGVTTYDLSPQGLTLRRTILFFSRTQNISADKIQKISQFKDGGGEEDSFPSWGLNLHTERKIKLLAGETIDKSDWLGSELASYYDIKFEPSKDRE